MNQGTAIALAALAVLANGFFVAAEFAIAKARGARIDELAEQGNRRARFVRHMLERREAYLFACQVGITFASLGLGWLGQAAVARSLASVLGQLGLTDPTTVQAIAFLLAFGVLAFFHIAVGEQAPKSVAVGNPERWAMGLAWPLRAFYLLASPFIFISNAASRVMLRLLRIDPSASGELALTEEDLKQMVASSHEGGMLDEAARDMLDNVFEFSDHTVHEVMVPRTRMACLHVAQPFEENIACIRETMHTRYPLLRDDRDHVIGMVHLKDLYFALLDSGAPSVDLESVKRDIIAVPETMSISDLLALFRTRRVHMAIAIDEYGGTSGLITLEDLIEELVGEIEDEFDEEEEEPIVPQGEDAWLVDGNLNLRDLAKATGQRIEEEDVDSVGGFVMLHMNRIPQQGDTVRVEALEFEIVRMNDYEVGRVKVTCCPSDDGNAAEKTEDSAERKAPA